MPLYDRLCEGCQHQLIDVVEPMTPPEVPCPKCGGRTVRAWLTKPSNVIGDECDIWIKHGLCDAVTGEPRRYTSKIEIMREAKRRGFVNYTTHVPQPGSDKSPHTVRWI